MNVLQDWVCKLGLRYQGVLIASVRGCDTVSKHNTVKDLVRAYRAVILNSFCGDPKKSSSFIEVFSDEKLADIMTTVVASAGDELPHHYVMHMIHSAEIVGYYHPNEKIGVCWQYFYERMCVKMHVRPETIQELERRLNAPEEEFQRLQAV